MASSSVAALTQAEASPSSSKGLTHSNGSVVDNLPVNGAASKEMGVAADAETSSVEEDKQPATQAQAPTPADCGCDDEAAAIAQTSTVNDEIPRGKQLDKAFALPVYDTKGEKHTFKSVVDRTGIEKHLIIFIRHFFCGLCQQYITRLHELLPPSSLPSDTAITIIANGHHSYIETYKQITSCPYDIYVDPDNSPLYAAFQLRHTLVQGAKPKYVTSSLLGLVKLGVTQGLAAGRNALRGGNSRQVGGEFLFKRDARSADAWSCTWAHRMQTTRGHVEVEVLRDLLLSKQTNGAVGTDAVAADAAAVTGGTPAARNPRVGTLAGEQRLGRRMSARISGLWKREGASPSPSKESNGTNGFEKSDKANGKAPVPADNSVADATVSDAATLDTNGGTIRPVAVSPRLA